MVIYGGDLFPVYQDGWCIFESPLIVLSMFFMFTSQSEEISCSIVFRLLLPFLRQFISELQTGNEPNMGSNSGRHVLTSLLVPT